MDKNEVANAAILWGFGWFLIAVGISISDLYPPGTGLVIMGLATVVLSIVVAYIAFNDKPG